MSELSILLNTLIGLMLGLQAQFWSARQVPVPAPLGANLRSWLIEELSLP